MDDSCITLFRVEGNFLRPLNAALPIPSTDMDEIKWLVEQIQIMVNSLIPTLQSVPLHSPTVSTSTAVKSLYGVRISEWLLLIGIYPDDSRDQRQSPLIHLCINAFRVLSVFNPCECFLICHPCESGLHMSSLDNNLVYVNACLGNHQCIRTFLYVNLNHPLASSVLVTCCVCWLLSFYNSVHRCYDSPCRFIVF